MLSLQKHTRHKSENVVLTLLILPLFHFSSILPISRSHLEGLNTLNCYNKKSHVFLISRTDLHGTFLVKRENERDFFSSK